MRTIIYFLFIGCFFASCAKEQMADERYYYAKIEVDQVRLPGTPLLELRYNGEKIMELPNSARSMVKADEEGLLSVHTVEGGILVADTLIRPAKDDLLKFRVAYTEQYGLKGWVKSPTVHPDSLLCRFQNSLSEAAVAVDNPDLYIYFYDWNTGGFNGPLIVLNNFKRNELHPLEFKLPVYDADRNSLLFFGRLKDPATGEFITIPALGTDAFYMEGFGGDGNGGSNGLYILRDHPDGRMEVLAFYL